MEEKVILLSVGKAYSFQTDTGDTMSGCTCWFISTDNLKPFEDDVNGLGTAPTKATMYKEFFDEAKQVGVPCTATAHYVMRKSGGKMTLQVDGFSNLKPFS